MKLFKKISSFVLFIFILLPGCVLAEEIQNAGVKQVKIRSALTCKSHYGVCRKCYGRNLATGGHVDIGEAVGIIAAQSIGEPGTQLTMRTFHSGGVASVADMTQGLPRVEELFEARKPNNAAMVSEVGGKVHIQEVNNRKCVIVHTPNGDVEYLLPAKSVITVSEGQVIESGTPLTFGSLYPQDILRTRGVKDAQEYLLKEVLSVYKSQSVDLDAKHIEIIIRQMLRNVRVESSGDTDLIPGDIIDLNDLEEINLKAIMAGKMPASAKRILQGLTKASLSTNSFLSAASFQESSRVLTDAAIKGKVDHLVGLKENVIIGKLIPAGTGLKRYNTVTPTVYEEVKQEIADENERLYPDSQDEEVTEMEQINDEPASAEDIDLDDFDLNI